MLNNAMRRTGMPAQAGRPTRRVPSSAALLRKAGLYVLLVLTAMFTLLPLLWAVAASFMPDYAIFQYTVPFSWHAFWPEPFTLSSYGDLLDGPFLRALGNSLLVCGLTVAGGIAVNSLAGFAFATFRFRGKGVLFFLVLVSFTVPFEIVAIPLYGIVSTLHLTNSYQALVLPALANGVVIFLFTQFFADVPRELYDAARIDGLNWYGIFARIVLPLSGPVVISAGLLLFLGQWESFLWPLLVANDPHYEMVQVALSNFHTQYVEKWGDQLAGSVVVSAVPAIILLALQRHYVRSVAMTGIKE
jgi:multiple sugar transport system permease protein